MAVIGRAQVLVTPSFKGMQKAVAAGTAPAASSGGKAFGSTFSKWAKRGAAAGAVAVGAVLTGALAKGFGRLKAIEEAQAKLRGLGHDAKSVEKIMKNALASVKGTSFGLGEAATTAASLVAAGIKPGQELEKVLKSVANSAAAAGVGMDEMGAIYAKVASVGKAQNDVLRQVAERGIPIYEALAKQLGVTTAEVEKMAAAGEISFSEFEKAMTTASGTVAKEMGKTFTGRLANAWAALGRIGANLLSGIFPKMGNALGKITDALAPMEDRAAALGEAFGQWVTRAAAGLAKVGGWLQRNADWLLPIVSGVLAMVAAYKAYVTVMAAVQLATKAWAAAQVLLNAVLSANPIGIIIMALVGLGTALVVAYKKSETFRNIVNGAWASIKLVVGSVVGWFTGTALPFLKMVFTAIGTAASWLWGKVLKPTFTAIRTAFQVVGSAIRKVWNGFLRPVFELFGAIVKRLYQVFIRPYVNAIRAIWSALGTAIRSVYNRHIKPIVDAVRRIVAAMRATISAQVAAVKTIWAGMGTAIRNTYSRHVKPIFDALRRGLGTVKNAFKVGVDGIRAQWAKLEAATKKPVRFVINTVLNNGLIAGFNKLARTFGTKQMARIPLPKGFRHGGEIPGSFNPAFRDNLLIRAEPGEWYINRRSSKRMEQAFPGYLKYINTHGEPPGFKSGGQVAPVPGRGNRHTSGYPWATWAGDFPQPTGTAVKAWKDGVVAAVKHLTTSYGKHVRMNHTDGSSSLYAHMSRILVRVGQQLTAGQRLGLVGSTGNSTGPHLHFETMKGAFSGGSGDDGGGSGFDLLGAIKDLVAGPMKKLKELRDTPFGRLVAGAGSKIGDMFKDKAASLFKNVTDKIGNVAGSADIAARWGTLITKHLIKNRMPLTLLDNFVRQIKSESGGNPAAVQQVRDVNWPHNKAVGLLQLIPGTFAQYRDPSLPNNRKNGESSIAASIRYVKARYGKSAERVIGHGHGYDSGGMLPPGYTLAFNGTRRPEPVFTGKQWDKLDALLAQQGGPQRIHGELTLRNGKAYIEGIVADVAGDAMMARSL